MKFKSILIIALVIAALAGLVYQNSFVDAATSNPSVASPGFQLIVLPVSASTVTTTGIVKLTAPWPFRVVSFYAVSNTINGLVLADLTNAAGTSLLASKVTMSTVTSEATLTSTSSTLNITDESTLLISTSSTGTFGNGTFTIGIKRQ